MSKKFELFTQLKIHEILVNHMTKGTDCFVVAICEKIADDLNGVLNNRGLHEKGYKFNGGFCEHEYYEHSSVPQRQIHEWLVICPRLIEVEKPECNSCSYQKELRDFNIEHKVSESFVINFCCECGKSLNE